MSAAVELKDLSVTFTAGRKPVRAVDDVSLSVASGEVRPFLEPLVRAGSARTGERYGLVAAEEFRIVTYGGLEPLLERFGVRRPASQPDGDTEDRS